MADTTTMIPFSTEANAWSPTLGAFAGSLFGNFFWGNGGFWGNRGYGYGCGYEGYGASPAVGLATGIGLANTTNTATHEALIMDDLSRITEQLGDVNSTLLNSQAQQSLAMSQGFCSNNDAVKDANISLSGTINDGFSRLSRDVTSGISDVSRTVIQENNNVTQQMNNNFARLSHDICGIDKSIMGSTMGLTQTVNSGMNNVVNAVNSNGTQARFDTMNGFNQLQRAVSDCCCNTQSSLREGFGNLALENCKNTGFLANEMSKDTGILATEIAKEGCATRALINENYINDLQTKLCDAKAKISSLESQQYTGNALAAQSAVFDAKLSNAINVIIGALKTNP